EDAIESCREISTKYSCVVIADIACDLLPALTDGKALGQCLRNLLVNAMKYGEMGGRIEVSAQSRKQAHTTEIEISVANQGRAIDGGDLPHIFEPFFRGKNTANTTGNGLGLYMVESIMKALGGRIEVTSSVEETRFTLHVPASTK